MSNIRHNWTPESASRGGKNKGNGISQTVLRKRQAHLERIRSGDPSPQDAVAIKRWHKQDVDAGTFEGDLEAWCKLNRVELKKDEEREDGTAQAHIEAAVRLGGQEAAWGLLLISGQIPPIPDTSGRLPRAYV